MPNTDRVVVCEICKAEIPFKAGFAHIVLQKHTKEHK